MVTYPENIGGIGVQFTALEPRRRARLFPPCHYSGFFKPQKQGVSMPVASDQIWKDEIQKKLDERDIIAFESTGILTSKDVLAAIDIVDRLDAARDETEEWNHIKELQRERTKRMAGGVAN